MRPEERREFQRMTLAPPVAGTLGTTPVIIIEVGVLGAKVQHSTAIEERVPELHFAYSGNDIGIKCELIRTFPGVSDAGMQSGLRFLGAIGDSGEHRLFGPCQEESIVGDVAGRRLAIEKRRWRQHRSQRRCRLPQLSLRKQQVEQARRFPARTAIGRLHSAQVSDSDEMRRLCRVYEHPMRRPPPDPALRGLSISDVLEFRRHCRVDGAARPIGSVKKKRVPRPFSDSTQI
jgi:hypothetical protein